ncbi:MAG: DinB family protein [Terriglobales bacterium]
MADWMDLLREHLLYLLGGGGAHVSFDDAVKDLPVRFRGVNPPGGPHTPWELLEHMRLAQADILDFCRNPNYREPPFPAGYWPEGPAPGRGAWDKSVKAFRTDLKAMQKLAADKATDLFAPIAWGDGQTILREALLVADHNAYHLGQLVMVRRMLGAWRE